MRVPSVKRIDIMYLVLLSFLIYEHLNLQCLSCYTASDIALLENLATFMLYALFEFAFLIYICYLLSF